MHIKCNLRPATIAPFNAWIARHGARQVQSLEAEGTECGADRLLLQLPWDKLSALESLTLDQFKLPAVSDSSSRDGSGSTNALLPRLQQLHLEYCNLHSADCLAQLVSGSSALTSLVVEGYPFADHSCGQQLRFSEPLYGLLAQQLSQLVELRLPYLSFSLPVLERLKGMQTLHDLACDVSDVVASDGWSAHLPSSLTRLRLGAGHTHEHAIPLSPQLQHLASSLRELHLLDVPVEPEQLAGMTGLNVLCLRSCMLQPAHDVTSAVGTAALLAALQQMTQLRHLQLADLNLDTETGPIGQWSALTASRQLRFLEVEYCMWDALPEGAAQHIFPPGRQLLQLHTLHLTGLGSTFEDHTWLDGADVGRLISACPRLEDLCLANALCEDADVSVLLQLPQCCSSLTIAGAAFNDAAVRVIVELTSLKELCWRDSPALSDVGLQQLSALTALTQVEVSNCGLSANVLEAAMGDPNENCVYLRDDDEVRCGCFVQVRMCV